MGPVKGDAQITAALLRWGSDRLRDLPWRRTNDAWEVFVSEVMLQQTSVARVLPKYGAFIERFPTPQSLADAPLADALALWQGLGYPRRCRNLQAAARAIVEEHSGAMPRSLEELLALPGVGAYTARAILAFAHRADAAVVDTNVARVIARIDGRPHSAKEIQARADALLPLGMAWEWNQIIMDFGAGVCTARAPKCGTCALTKVCAWKGDGDVEDPATRTHGTSRPQARFEGSNRQARGRAMRAAELGVTLDEMVAHMQLHDDRERAHSVIQTLLDDGLIAESDGVFTLPT